eukprot:s5759_g2.t1
MTTSPFAKAAFCGLSGTAGGLTHRHGPAACTPRRFGINLGEAGRKERSHQDEPQSGMQRTLELVSMKWNGRGLQG